MSQEIQDQKQDETRSAPGIFELTDEELEHVVGGLQRTWIEPGLLDVLGGPPPPPDDLPVQAFGS